MMKVLNVSGYDPAVPYLVACAYIMRGRWRVNGETGVGGYF